jgi:hypothetical protein
MGGADSLGSKRPITAATGYDSTASFVHKISNNKMPFIPQKIKFLEFPRCQSEIRTQARAFPSRNKKLSKSKSSQSYISTS